MARKHTKLTWLLILLVGSLTVIPVFMLVLGSFSKGLRATGSFTLDKYISVYTDPAFAEILGNTLIFVLGSAVFATILALFLAYLNNRTEIGRAHV